VANCRTFWFRICCKPQTILVVNLLPREVEEGGGTKAGRRRLFNCRQPSVCPSSSGSARFHLRLPTSTKSPLLLSLCLAHFSRSLDPQPPRHFRSLLPLYRTHFRSHTHPPTRFNPPYPTSQYIFLSIYLSIYLSIPFCCPELVLNPPADNSPFSKNQNPPSNQQALTNCFCFQNHIPKLSLHYYCLA
jgi:hypothetical protein